MSTSLQGRQPESAVLPLERNSPLERRDNKTPSQPESSVPARTVLFHDASPSTSVGATELPHRLQASKPVSWRGRGDLYQVPWTSPPRGTWLVLDLWAGYSGLCVALLQLGMHFYAVAAECDDVARAVAHHNMPNIVHVTRRVPDGPGLCPFLAATQREGRLDGGRQSLPGQHVFELGQARIRRPPQLPTLGTLSPSG